MLCLFGRIVELILQQVVELLTGKNIVEFFFPEQEHMKLFYLYTQRHV
jgi:hypothetical protein